MKTGSGLIVGALVIASAWLHISHESDAAGALAIVAFIAVLVLN